MPIATTILNGFLGAGKTTLMQSLLVQARDLNNVTLGVIVNEMSTLDGSLRRIVQRGGGFDANFMGMTRDSADLACRRLTARNVDCAPIGPS